MIFWGLTATMKFVLSLNRELHIPDSEAPETHPQACYMGKVLGKAAPLGKILAAFVKSFLFNFKHFLTIFFEF